MCEWGKDLVRKIMEGGLARARQTEISASELQVGTWGGGENSILGFSRSFQRNESHRQKTAPAGSKARLAQRGGAAAATWVRELFVSENGPCEGKSILAKR